MAQTLDKIWYRKSDKGITWLLAYNDRGQLVFQEDTLEFRGKKNRIVIRNINRLTMVRLGTGNNRIDWVKVDYDDSSTALFTAGAWLGFQAKFGGAKRILQAIQEFNEKQKIKEA